MNPNDDRYLASPAKRSRAVRQFGVLPDGSAAGTAPTSISANFATARIDALRSQWACLMTAALSAVAAVGTRMRKMISRTWQWSARILCAMALLLVGFAHQPVVATADEISPLELAQYRLPDGSLPIICITYRDADGKVHGKAYAPGCEACRIASATVLPIPPTEICERLASSRGETVVARAEAFHRQLYPPNSGPRAPPVLDIVG